jgi:peptidoglycan hydrolase-like protein with peptidoglycan-binding domain
MNKVIFLLLSCLLLCIGINGQTATDSQASASHIKTEAKPKRQIFRANKSQITEVQKMLKTKGIYSGEATGKLDDTTRISIKTFQQGNGLKQTGTLNRATLEKMGIELTDKQKLIPVSPNSYATADSESKSTEAKPKRVIFRATKAQIADAQKLLKEKGMYSGDETGKLDDATREGLKKFQEASSVKVTGTLNQITLEKMGIELTEKQKGDAAVNK